MGLTDWLAATFFISDDDVQTHKDVAVAQQNILDTQLADGNRSLASYLDLSQQVTDAGNYTADYKDANSGLLGFLKAIPWWVYLLAAGGAFFWLGGFSWLRGILKKP